MPKTWTAWLPLALVGCGVELSPVEDSLTDGAVEAGETDDGAIAPPDRAGSTGASRGAVVSPVPRAPRVTPAIAVAPPPSAEARAMAPRPPPPTAREPVAIEPQRFADLLDGAARATPGVEIAARWTREASVDQIVIAGDRVSYSSGGAFHVASLSTGAVARSATFPDCRGCPARVTGGLYALCGDEIAAVDPATLAIRWRRDLGNRASQIADGGGSLFVALSGSYTDRTQDVLAIATDGTTRWRATLPAGVELRADGDRLFAFERDPSVWRLDPDSGRVLWSRTSDKAILDVARVSDEVTAVVGLEHLWLVDGEGRDLVVRAPTRNLGTVAGGRLLTCDDEGRLHAVDARDGREAWWARVSVAGEECAVLAATDGTVLVQGAGRLIALDTTRAAPPAPAVAIRGRFEDVYTKHGERGVAVLVGGRRVHADEHGRFAATVHVNGPIEVRLADEPRVREVVWPDSRDRHRVRLSNYVEPDESCH